MGKCKDCRWWEVIDDEGGHIGWCGRYPPIFKGKEEYGLGSLSEWPKTGHCQGCGEFKERLLTPEQCAARPEVHLTADEIRDACDSGKITNYAK